MRRYLACMVGTAFLLIAMGALAQRSHTGRQATTTTTTTTTEKSTVSGTEHTIEGCLMKESSDFFLIPARGTPIQLQAGAGQDLAADEGHKVKISGVESALSASSSGGNTGGTSGAVTSSATAKTPSGTHTASSSVSSPSGQNESSQSGTASSGTGNDLHHLASRQITVTKVVNVADSCPVNWNSRVPTKR